MGANRRLTWLIFAVCVLLVVDGLGWVTWQVLRLERSERLAREDARTQEAVRLALWRMDGLLGPILAAEVSRPYFHYRAFYPATRAYNRMWEPVAEGEVLVPSPLLAGPGRFIRLHFESTPEGWLTSPQAPDESLRDRLGADALPVADMLEIERRLVELTAILRTLGTEGASPRGPEIGPEPGPARGADRYSVGEQARLRELARTAEEGDALPPPPEAAREEADDRSLLEFEARRRSARQARELGAEPGPVAAAVPVPEDGVRTGRFRPAWRDHPSTGEPELLFVRVVTVGGRELLQGFWLDWPALRRALLASVEDLLPEATLAPAGAPEVEGALPVAHRSLAEVPAVLSPGLSGEGPPAGLTPTRVVLLVAWVAVLAAVVAIGLVLRASLALSDRRGRFVSAVTHELRTPLTTFCLYSQMLADGLVEGEERRAEYLRTLRRESDRLASIVENVLVYARAAGRRREVEPSPVEGLVRRVVEEQGPAAARAGMSLELDMEGVEGLQVGVDGPSLERILGNLIENACRYASGASDRRITVRVRPEGRGVEVRVRDRGPGVAWRERHRVFMPFARGRDRRGEESGGLGLGLALARSVARSLGGEVRLARPGAGNAGAEFVVWLPANNPPAGA